MVCAVPCLERRLRRTCFWHSVTVGRQDSWEWWLGRTPWVGVCPSRWCKEEPLSARFAQMHIPHTSQGWLVYSLVKFAVSLYWEDAQRRNPLCRSPFNKTDAFSVASYFWWSDFRKDWIYENACVGFTRFSPFPVGTAFLASSCLAQVLGGCILNLRCPFLHVSCRCTVIF